MNNLAEELGYRMLLIENKRIFLRVQTNTKSSQDCVKI